MAETWSSHTTATTAQDFKGIAGPLAVITAVVCVATLWMSAGNHPLYPPDEGRYGAVSLHMAQTSEWLVPQYEGHAHLTKPPLTYWAQALCIRWLGPSEAALRFPSLIASSVTMLLVLWGAWCLGGARVAALSIGTLAMMPLFMIVGRLATTDAMLNFFWIATLFCGYVAVQTGRWRWAGLMWLAVAGGLMTKGPIALVPFGLLLLWLALGKRMRNVRQLRLLLGLPIAIAPLAAWVVLIAMNQPEAIEVWRYQLLDRITGSGDHPEPLWYLIPIFFVGLFPATAMLTLPGLNISFRETWAKLRAAEPSCLLALGVVVPLLLFSVTSGKLITYLLPLCAPLAVLNGRMLARWTTGAADAPERGSRPPEVVAALSVITILTVGAAITAAAIFEPALLRDLLPMSLAPVACFWLWWLWKRRPAWRAVGLAVVWAAWMFAWDWIFELEDALGRTYGASSLIARLPDLTGENHQTIVTYGFSDPTLNFYNDLDLTRMWTIKELLAAPTMCNGKLVLLIDDDRLGPLVEERPELGRAYEQVGAWQRSPTHRALILRPRSVATPSGNVSSFQANDRQSPLSGSDKFDD